MCPIKIRQRNCRVWFALWGNARAPVSCMVDRGTFRWKNSQGMVSVKLKIVQRALAQTGRSRNSLFVPSFFRSTPGAATAGSSEIHGSAALHYQNSDTTSTHRNHQFRLLFAKHVPRCFKAQIYKNDGLSQEQI